MSDLLTIAVPKGRQFERFSAHLAERGVDVVFADRELVATSHDGTLRFLLVKNDDLATYVGHGIAGLGVCGTDKLDETSYEFYALGALPFGGARMCLIGRRGQALHLGAGAAVKVATRYPAVAREFFHNRGIPVDIIKLSGSVELAVVLGLAPLIVDVVETGRTLAAHDLEIIEEIGRTEIQLVANPAIYKIRYRQVRELAERLLAPLAVIGDGSD